MGHRHHQSGDTESECVADGAADASAASTGDRVQRNTADAIVAAAVIMHENLSNRLMSGTVVLWLHLRIVAMQSCFFARSHTLLIQRQRDYSGNY